MTEIRIQPVIPIWLIVLLLLAGGVGIWLSYGRCALSTGHRYALLGVRTLTLVILALLLLQPELLRVRQETEKPTVPVLVDVSASMRDSEGEDHSIRAENARRYLKNPKLRGLDDRYQLSWYEVGAGLEAKPRLDPDKLEFNAPRTHLADALNDLGRKLRGTNVAGVVLLTDGLDQSTAELIPEARRLPLYIPELAKPPPETPKATSDTWVDDVNYPKMLVVNWKGQIDVTVKRNGRGKLVCPVHLSRRGERIRTGYATFADNEMVKQVTFGIEPFEVGRTTYRVEIEPPGDTDTANNSRQFVIDITDPKNRVLYLEGTPRWEFKFVKRALLKEKNYYISAFVQSGDGIFVNFSEDADAASVGELPEFTEEKLLDYRVIILGEMTAAALNEAQQKALVAYVDKGGGLLFLGGHKAYGPEGWQSSETMAKLLPFTSDPNARMTEGRLPVAPTSLGRGHPVLSGMTEDVVLPNILSLWGPVKAKPSAASLLEVTDGSPLLLVSQFGKGKVAAILSDSLWRWQLGAASTGDEKGLYDRFMSQLVYWLSPRQEKVDTKSTLQVLTAQAQAEVRQRVVIGAILGEQTNIKGDVKLGCTVTLPDRREVHLDMTSAKLGPEVGLDQELWGWRTEFVPSDPGEYKLTVEEAATKQKASTMILVEEPQLEITGAPINRAYLQRLAQQTGGKYVPYDEINTLLDGLPYKPLDVRTTTQTPLWNKGWVLLLLLGLFIAEWYCRSKLDLV